jgi:thioredoxin 1
MIMLDDTNFEETIKGPGVVVVDFFADWCGPCKMMAPSFEEVAAEYAGKAKFYKLNVDMARETAMKNQVMSIPTLMFYKDGVQTGRSMGALDTASIKAKVDAVL